MIVCPRTNGKWWHHGGCGVFKPGPKGIWLGLTRVIPRDYRQETLTGRYFRQSKGAQTQISWSGYLPVVWGSSTWRLGAKKFVFLSKPRENKLFGGIKLFGRDLPGFLPGCPKGAQNIINKFAGLSRDWLGGKFLFTCCFRVIPYGAEKHINKILPKSQKSPMQILFMRFFLVCCFHSPIYLRRGSLCSIFDAY